MDDQFRRIPQVQSLLETDTAIALIGAYGHADVTNSIRLKLDDMRRAIRQTKEISNQELHPDKLLQDIAQNLRASRQVTLKPVINATGVIISTNLGRAKLAPEAIAAIQAIADTYSTLEIDLATGKRGSRQSHVEALICKLTGAEAALVVNNCAAAVLVSLSALAAKRDVIVSRGELVEIGGSFRMPDVIVQSGAHLKEVGATNKTHLSDYENAMSDETALLLKSHTSNFKIVGFTSAPSREDLVALASKSNLPLIEDLGSGLLVSLADHHLPDEPIVRDVLAAGVDLVMFSGDKLLGGPQSGIIAGKRSLIDQISKHPISRACRIDKFSLAALHATLELYMAPNDPFRSVPVLVALSEPLTAIRGRAARLMRKIDSFDQIQANLISSVAFAGGGTLPEQDLPSFAVSIAPLNQSVESLSRRLRQAPKPVLGRISKNQLMLDMRTISDHEVYEIADALHVAASI